MTISENNKIINSLQFYYGTPKDNYKRFEIDYEPYHLLQKIIIIPVVVIAGTIKVIFHIARAIFQGMFQVVRGNKLPLQADIYHVVRDLQCILGVILTIFNDKLGVYLVKNSLFQKSCYDDVIKDNVELFEYMSGDQIKKLNLKDVTEDQLKDMFYMSIFVEDNVADSEIKNKFARFSVEQVQSILLKLDGQGFLCISDEQLKGLNLKDVTKDQLKKMFSISLCDNVHVIDRKIKDQFANFSIEQVQSILLKLDRKGFSCISDEQLKGLDLKDLSDKQISHLLFPSLDSQYIENRFANLSVEQVQSILLKLDEDEFSYISDDQLKGLDLKDLSKEKLAALFLLDCGWTSTITDRFANLSVEQVQSILLKLDGREFSYISDDQLKGLDLTDLSKENIGILFPTLSEKGIREDPNLRVSSMKEIFHTLFFRSSEKDIREESNSRVLSANEVLNETERRTQQNTFRLALLTDTQFNQIKDKLEEAILNLRK